MAPTTNKQRPADLDGITSAMAARLTMVTLLGGLASGAGLMLIVFLTAVWLDLMVDLAEWLRVAAVIVSILALPTVLIVVAARLSRGRRPLAIARRLDAAGGAAGIILSGADLHYDTVVVGDVSRSLARMAVAASAQRAAEVPAGVAVPMRPAVLPVTALLGLGIGIALAASILPRLASTEWLRFVDPYGDHPPYSSLVFDVSPQDTSVVYGDSLDIVVEPSGAPVEHLDLVLESNAGADVESLPMFPRADGAWTTTIVNVVRPTRYFVRTGGARSHKYDIELITVPLIEQVRCRVTPPSYTRLRPFESEVPAGGIIGLAGTRVDLFARSNRPLSGGELHLRAGAGVESQKLTPTDEPDLVTGSFDISTDASLELLVTDREGQRSRDVFKTRVQMTIDQRPFIRIVEPPETSFATPDTLVPVAVSAEDDYGVSRIELYRSLNGSRGLPLQMETPSPPTARCTPMTALPLARYGLSPGDVIKLYARVEDNDPAGAKGSESAIVSINIISVEDYQRLMLTRQGMDVLQSKYAEARRRVEALAEELDKLLQQAEIATEEELTQLQQRIAELAEKMREEAQAIRDSADVPLPFDLDRALNDQLSKLAEAVSAGAADLAPAASNPAAGKDDMRKAMQAARDRLAESRQQFQEGATEPLELLAKMYPLMEDQARFVEIYQRQASLAERLADLNGRDGEDDPALKRRMRDLEDEQTQVRRELDLLLTDIVNHAKALPDDERTLALKQTALEFAQAVRASEADPQMGRAIDGLAEFLGTSAADGAADAAETLARFLSRCQMGNEANQCIPKFQPKLAGSIQATAEQLLAAAGMQQGNGGIGAGGGYSARRSTLQNVGLYGNLPTLAGATGSGHRRDGLTGVMGGQDGGPGHTPNVTVIEALRELSATGSSDVAVPEAYRRRVGEYFRRIADELGDE